MRRACVVLICVVTMAHVSWAASISTEITPDNIKEQPYRFTITSKEHDGGTVEITVVVAPKEKNELSPMPEGKLNVRKGNAQIASCSLRDYQKKGTILYRFKVDKRYLAESIFSYVDWGGTVAHPNPSFSAYWFKLASFIKIKGDG